MIERRLFRAMGTEIELLVDASGADDQLDDAEAVFHRLEEILTRFRPESELSRLNENGVIEAGDDLLRLTELALEAREQTGGRFDPTVHDAVVAAGYDRTFDELPRDGGPVPTARCGGAVRVDGRRIELDPGVRLDFGGIGKGYAADRAADVLAAAGPCLVNAGGDVAIRGGAWPIGIETGRDTLTVELMGGALATSGRDRRRWRRGGRELHHLIDPRSGAPADGDLLRATVVARDAVGAEVWAKALFLAGRAAAAAEADDRGLPAVLVAADGRTELAGGLCVKDPTFWILARASGLTAYVLLTLSVLAGLVIKTRPFGRALNAAAVADTHRFLSLLALGAVAVHGLALVLDSTVRIGLGALLVPGLAGYRPIADRARCRRRGARRSDRRLLPAPRAGSASATGAACTGRRMRCSAWPPRTASLPAPTPRGPGRWASTSAPCSRSRSQPPGASLTRPDPKGVTRVQDRDRPLAV